MSKLPNTLSSEESENLLAHLKYYLSTINSEKRCHRNYTMALLMLDAGLRVSEVVNLTGRDLMFDGKPVESIVIRAEITKTKTERVVPTTERIKIAIRLMAEWVWMPKINLQVCQAFYQHDNGKALSTRQVQRIIETASMESIGRKITPHILRHTFATRLMRVTNIRTVQELLGHRRLSSTQIYTHPNGDDLKKAIGSI